jgi:hypothetical protein
MKKKSPNISLDIYYPEEGVTKPTVFVHPDNLADYLPDSIKATLTARFNEAERQLQEMEKEAEQNKPLNEAIQKELEKWNETAITKNDNGFKAIKQLMDYDIEKVKSFIEGITTPQLRANILMVYKLAAKDIDVRMGEKQHPGIKQFIIEVGKLHTKYQNEISEDSKNSFNPSLLPERGVHIEIQSKYRETIIAALTPHVDSPEDLANVLNGCNLVSKIGFKGKILSLCDLFRRLHEQDCFEYDTTSKRDLQNWICNWFTSKHGNRTKELSPTTIWGNLTKNANRPIGKDRILPELQNLFKPKR